MSDNYNFILQTASDYDIPQQIVEEYHKRYFDNGTFYEKLECYLNERASF